MQQTKIVLDDFYIKQKKTEQNVLFSLFLSIMSYFQNRLRHFAMRAKQNLH